MDRVVLLPTQNDIALPVVLTDEEQHPSIVLACIHSLLELRCSPDRLVVDLNNYRPGFDAGLGSDRAGPHCRHDHALASLCVELFGQLWCQRLYGQANLVGALLRTFGDDLVFIEFANGDKDIPALTTADNR